MDNLIYSGNIVKSIINHIDKPDIIPLLSNYHRDLCSDPEIIAIISKSKILPYAYLNNYKPFISLSKNDKKKCINYLSDDLSTNITPNEILNITNITLFEEIIDKNLSIDVRSILIENISYILFMNINSKDNEVNDIIIFIHNFKSILDKILNNGPIHDGYIIRSLFNAAEFSNLDIINYLYSDKLSGSTRDIILLKILSSYKNCESLITSSKNFRKIPFININNSECHNKYLQTFHKLIDNRFLSITTKINIIKLVTSIKNTIFLDFFLNLDNNLVEGALYLSVENNNIECIKYLLDKNINIEILNNAITLASENNKVDIIKLLLDKGDNHTKNNILIIASINGSIKILRSLLDQYTYDQEIKDDAFEGAVNFNKLEIVLLLLANGISQFAKNRGLETARYWNYDDIISLLE